MPVKSPSATPHPLQTVPWGQCWRKTEVTEDGFVVQEEILPPTGTLRPPTTKPGGVSSIQAKCKDEVSPVMWGQTELNNHVRRKTVCFQGAGASLDLFDCGFVKMNALVSALGLGLDVVEKPESVCDNPLAFWAGFLSYWMMSVHKAYLLDRRLDTAMNCFETCCSGTFPGPYPGEWAEGHIGPSGERIGGVRATYSAILAELSGLSPPPPSPTPVSPPPSPSPPMPPSPPSWNLLSPFPSRPPPPTPEPPGLWWEEMGIGWDVVGSG